jgi:hypothetical protein
MGVGLYRELGVVGLVASPAVPHPGVPRARAAPAGHAEDEWPRGAAAVEGHLGEGSPVAIRPTRQAAIDASDEAAKIREVRGFAGPTARAEPARPPDRSRGTHHLACGLGEASRRGNREEPGQRAEHDAAHCYGFGQSSVAVRALQGSDPS